MNIRSSIAAWAGAFLLTGAGATALAGPPSLANSVVWSAAHGARCYLSTSPNGAYSTAMTSARTLAGEIFDATIHVFLADDAGNPVVDYPAADVWLESSLGNLKICASNPMIADFASEYFQHPPLPEPNPDRRWSTTFTGRVFGGGFTEPGLGEVLQVFTATTGATPLTALEPLDIQFYSTDVNGDLVVDLQDTGFFAEDYHSGTYVRRSDFYFDGVLNLNDIAIYASSYFSSGTELSRCP